MVYVFRFGSGTCLIFMYIQTIYLLTIFLLANAINKFVLCIHKLFTYSIHNIDSTY